MKYWYMVQHWWTLTGLFNEKSLTQKATYCMIPVIWNVKERESSLVTVKCMGAGNNGK